MYRSILLPLDGSQLAEHALPLAVELAQRAGATLQVVTVMERLSPIWPSHSQSRLATGWQAYLDRIVERVRSQAAISVSSHLLDGEAVAAIRAHAESNGVDLMVMSTHGRGALGRFWIGSVADQLIHSSPVPCLLTRPGASTCGMGFDLKHFLIPLDGGSTAERILEHAIQLGTLVGADYTLLRVIDVVPHDNPALDSLSLSSSAIDLLGAMRVVQQQVHDEAQAYLEEVAARLHGQGLRVRTRIVTRADPGMAILDLAVPSAVDLIAIETRGHQQDFPLGSVARKVIHGMGVLVLVQSAATSSASSVGSE